MRERVLVVPADSGGMTVQTLIHEEAGFPHSVSQGLVDAGCATIGGRLVENHAERLSPGTRVLLRYDPHTRYRPRPRPREGDAHRIIYEDDDIMVVDKDAGLLSVPTPDSDAPSLAERLFDSLGSRGIRRPQLYAVHRLDRAVSGLIVFVKSFEALWGLVPQFDTHAARRAYVALAHGTISRSRGTQRVRLVDESARRRVRAARSSEEGRPAVTRWTVMERFPEATLCGVELETGRKNQIRVHFREMGHPLVGDARYGEDTTGLGRVALHAGQLEFEHPIEGGRVSFRSPLPGQLESLLEHLRSGGRLAAFRTASRKTPSGAAAGGGSVARRGPREAGRTTEQRPAGRPKGKRTVQGADKPRRDGERGRSGKGKGHGREDRRGRSRAGRGNRAGTGEPAPEAARSGGGRGKPARDILRGRWSKGAPAGRRRRSTPADGSARHRRKKSSASTPAGEGKAPADEARSTGRGSGGRKSEPKSAWLRRREETRHDPRIPEWIKLKMGIKPGKGKGRKKT